jgi:hypothetical protein
MKYLKLMVIAIALTFAFIGAQAQVVVHVGGYWHHHHHYHHRYYRHHRWYYR